MAEDGSWPSILRYGLLSTSALLDKYGVTGAAREAIEIARRPESVILQRAGLPDAVIRDNKPMSDSALAKCLVDGLTPADWYKKLNNLTFFWLSKERLTRLLNARAYREKAQTIITIDTQKLVAYYEKKILLSPINSGSTIWRPQPRGNSTFLPISEYPFDDWKKRRPAREAIVEMAVPYSVPNIAEFVTAVHRAANGEITEIWNPNPSAHANAEC